MAKFPFTVCFAFTHDETNHVADVLLPDCTDLEGLQLLRIGGTKYVEQFWDYQGFALRDPAVAPQGEARDFTWIATELAKRAGLLAEHVKAPSVEADSGQYDLQHRRIQPIERRSLFRIQARRNRLLGLWAAGAAGSPVASCGGGGSSTTVCPSSLSTGEAVGPDGEAVSDKLIEAGTDIIAEGSTIRVRRTNFHIRQISSAIVLHPCSTLSTSSR